MTLINPFAGGSEAPIIQLVDLDGDGDLDLAAADRDKVLHVFERTSEASGQWSMRNDPSSRTTIQSWFRFADLDGDGDQDLFTGGQSSGVMQLRNVGSARSMVLYPRGIELLDVNGAPVLNEQVNVPAFADPDGDGDLDFFAGNSAGTIVYYENIGTPTSPAFRFVTDTYQGISIIGFGGAFPDTLATRTLHGAMGIAFGDLDGDGDLDLLWGDFFSPSLYYLRNSGTPTIPQYALVDSTFPDAYPLISSGFNVPTLGDIDDDGDLDMLVSVASGFQSLRNILLLRNEGSAATADFRFETANPLQTLDVGSMSRPAIGDVTGDGLDDIIIGEGGGAVRLLRQRPVSSGMSFDLDADTLLFLPGTFYQDPAVCDLDGDGLNEILLGDFSGKLRLFTGGGGWAEDTTFQFRGSSFGQPISPAIADLDGDGDQDLVLGLGNGRLQFYENTGTPSTPSFVLRMGVLDGIDVGDDAVPAFYDLTSDGRPDLLIGSRIGGVEAWVQFNGTFILYPGLPGDELLSTDQAPAVVSGAGKTYMVLGNLKGGLEILERNASIVRSLSDRSIYPPYPNPASSMVTIRFDMPQQHRVRISVVDIVGREVLRVQDAETGAGYRAESFSVRDLSTGVYFVRVSTGAEAAYPIVVVR